MQRTNFEEMGWKKQATKSHGIQQNQMFGKALIQY